MLVVETVDNLSAELKATQQGVGDGLSEVREVSDQRARLMERACSELSDEVKVALTLTRTRTRTRTRARALSRTRALNLGTHPNRTLTRRRGSRTR